MGRELGQLPGTEAGPGGPRKSLRSGLGCERQREQLGSESCSPGVTALPLAHRALTVCSLDLHNRSPGRLSCYLPHFTHGGTEARSPQLTRPGPTASKEHEQI